ncbi:peptidoglycan glycosyltransferase FtsI [Yersinia mollaretii]|uniref:peptidoglycan glycosyltransferase FtsI n=1 Tax=Yersinia mollaretii TaxID=33060 RepID=UPI0005E78C62|nr:peptidoglycan glycosyltransferase FtsI [Yersinia mollaretii]MDN0109531.1 peptidoglycan glycosyltransferase FtsI [Yersinia mollaretii]PJE88766.1 peptidoglycan glycosyltransferase FtsI [Yersinia mollaretii]CQD43663.1 peptidoglycan synthetase [Yersinia mollaretii]CQG97431.1 peptidoglycan synthetase [Yersinia mollaretii]
MISKPKNDSNNFIRWRFSLLCGSILMSFFGLIARVAWLQIIEPDPLVKEEDMRSVRVVETPNTRGMITDRNEHPLAVSVPVAAVWADPQTVLERGGVGVSERWQALAQALNMPLDQVSSRITQIPHARFIYLARQVEPNVAEYIQRLKLPGIATKVESRRFYPSGDIAANLVGFTNIDDQGIEGVEKSFNSLLSGTAGSRVVRKDRFGRVIEDISSTDSHPGQRVELSIDERLQAETSHALTNAVMFNKADSGSAVVIDVNTGEVLAMANYPTFNPNNRADTPEENFRNRAISDIFEPGSTVKPMVVMTALQRHLVKPDTVLDTHPYILSGHQIKDVGFYPALSLTGVLQKSSDVGVSRLALAMPASALMETYSLFGLGKPTQLGLTGESSGLMPHRQRWSDLDRATFSFGYGLMVTPLQLARVYATIGSFGIYRPLSITKVDPPVLGQRVFPEGEVREVEHMMESVALPGGGGTKAAVRGYRVAIKTGTAKKIGPNGQYIDKYVAYTAGVAPASQPRFALVVVINNPQGGKYYGGAVSAPVFSDIMGQILRTMNVEPDAIPTGVTRHS